MARLIDAVALVKVLREEMDYLLEQDKTKGFKTLKERMGLEVAIADIGDMPTVDAVEVVRCKDCKQLMLWCKPTDKVIGECFIRKMNSEDEQFCMVGADDFCSYGERKTNERKAD